MYSRGRSPDSHCVVDCLRQTLNRSKLLEAPKLGGGLQVPHVLQMCNAVPKSLSLQTCRVKVTNYTYTPGSSHSPPQVSVRCGNRSVLTKYTGLNTAMLLHHSLIHSQPVYHVISSHFGRFHCEEILSGFNEKKPLSTWSTSCATFLPHAKIGLF